MSGMISRLILLLLIPLVSGLSLSMVRAEEGAIQILAPWEGEGKMYQVGPDTIRFIGTFEGIMYMENNRHELSAASFVCPTTQDINTGTGEISAEGRCHIAAKHGKVFAGFECKGKQGSCEGEFSIIAGTDNLKGISGSGPMHARTAVGKDVGNITSGDAVHAAKGLVVWPEMIIKLPVTN